jgi:hypothetical protein
MGSVMNHIETVLQKLNDSEIYALYAMTLVPRFDCTQMRFYYKIKPILIAERYLPSETEVVEIIKQEAIRRLR